MTGAALVILWQEECADDKMSRVKRTSHLPRLSRPLIRALTYTNPILLETHTYTHTYTTNTLHLYASVFATGLT